MENQEKTVEDVKINETGATEQVVVTEDVEAKAQKIADAIVAKKLKDMPSKEEVKAVKEWKDAQKTESEKQAEKEKEQIKKEQENVNLKRENTLLKKGVNTDDIDYVQYKVSKMDGDFDENLELFLKDNAKYVSKNEETKVEKTTGVKIQGAESKESGVTAILREKHPEMFK